MKEITIVRLAIIGPRKGQIRVFERRSTTVKQARSWLRPGQQLKVVTISYGDDSPRSSRPTSSGEQT
jgi:hypothetical protein